MYESTTETTGYRGYIGSRRYACGEFPQSMQNLLIRSYCQKNQLTYLLSATEYAMTNCHMMLHEVVDAIDSLQGIVMFSIYMLPADRDKRLAIYHKVLITGKTLHGALEDISIRTNADVQMVEDILCLQQVIISSHTLAEYVDGERCSQPVLACA